MVVLVDYSKWKGAAVTLTLLALVMSMIAFMSTAWGVPSEVEYNDMFEGLGLWRYCRQNEDGSSNCKDTIGLDTPGWYQATQGVMTVAFILIFASQVVIVIAECVKRCRPNSGVVIAYVVVNLISVIFQVTGVGIFGAEIADHMFHIDDAEEDLRLKVSWSYILAAVAAGLQLFAAFFAMCELIFSKRVRRPLASSSGVHNVEMDSSVEHVESSTSRYEGF